MFQVVLLTDYVRAAPMKKRNTLYDITMPQGEGDTTYIDLDMLRQLVLNDVIHVNEDRKAALLKDIDEWRAWFAAEAVR